MYYSITAIINIIYYTIVYYNSIYIYIYSTHRYIHISILIDIYIYIYIYISYKRRHCGINGINGINI